MRVTTQILNNSADAAGIDISSRRTLASYIKSDDKSATSIENVLNGAIGTGHTNEYKGIRRYSDSLKNNLDTLSSNADKLTDANLLEEDKKKIISEITGKAESLVSDYNTLRKSLGRMHDALSNFYGSSLTSLIKDSKSELAAVGITADKSGALSFDKSALMNAEPDAIAAIFGEKSEFMQHMKFVAGKINDNAESNMGTYSNAYNAKGIASSMVSSLFDSHG